MSTTNINAVAYGVVGGQGFKTLHVPCTDSTAHVNQGDLVYLNANIAKSVGSDANAATLLGVALGPSSVSSNLDNGSAPAPSSLMVGWDVVANMKTTASETYNPGTLVYVGADAQTITTVTGTNAVGAVVLPLGVKSLTGAAGVTVGVLIKSHVY